jgi:hypothetical protein
MPDWLLNANNVIGTIAGVAGLVVSLVVYYKVEEVNTELDKFKKDFNNKRKQKNLLDSFNRDKNSAYSLSKELMTRTKGTEQIDGIVYISELNELSAVVKKIIANHKAFFDRAAISDEDKIKFEEFIRLVSEFNKLDNAEPTGEMSGLIKYIELSFSGGDVENEL